MFELMRFVRRNNRLRKFPLSPALRMWYNNGVVRVTGQPIDRELVGVEAAETSVFTRPTPRSHILFCRVANKAFRRNTGHISEVTNDKFCEPCAPSGGALLVFVYSS